MVRLIVIVAFVLLALAIFGIVWFITRRARRGPSATRRPVAPDDDPEFLRNLRLPDPPTDEDEDRG